MTEDEHSTNTSRILAEETTQEVSRFLGTILGSGKVHLDGLIGDRIGWWRLRQAVKLAKKAQTLLEQAGIDPNEVPFRTLVPLIESASLEDDTVLADRWAALLANAASHPGAVPASFPKLMAELEPEDAVILDDAYDQWCRLAPTVRYGKGISKPTLVDDLPGLSLEQISFHVDNLLRLRLLRGLTPLNLGDDSEGYVITEFGRRFVRACRPPGTLDRPVEINTEEEFKQLVEDQKARRE